MKKLMIFMLFTPLILLADETNSVVKSKSILLPRDNSTYINIDLDKSVDKENEAKIDVDPLLSESLVSNLYIHVSEVVNINPEVKSEISLYDLFKDGKLYWIAIYMKEAKLSGNELEYELMKIKFNELLDQWVNNDPIK